MPDIKRTTLILKYFATSPEIFPLSTENIFREGVHDKKKYGEFKKVFEKRANKLNESAPDWGKLSEKLKRKKYNVHFYAKWAKDSLLAMMLTHSDLNTHIKELSRQIDTYAKRKIRAYLPKEVEHNQANVSEYQFNCQSLVEKAPQSTEDGHFLRAYFRLFEKSLQQNNTIKSETIAFLLNTHIAGILRLDVSLTKKPTDEAKQEDWLREKEYKMTVLRIIANGVKAYYDDQLTPDLQRSRSNSDPVLCSTVTRVTNPLFEPTKENKTINPLFQPKAQDDAADASTAMQRLCLSPRSTPDKPGSTPRLKRSDVVTFSRVNDKTGDAAAIETQPLDSSTVSRPKS